MEGEIVVIIEGWALNKTVRGVVSITVILLLSVLIGACSKTESPQVQGADEKSSQVKSVKTVKAAMEGIQEREERIGEVQAAELIDVIAMAPGKVESVSKVKQGTVKRGEVLVEMDQTEADLQKQKSLQTLKMLEAQLRKTKSEASVGEKELKVSLKRLEQQREELTKQYKQSNQNPTEDSKQTDQLLMELEAAQIDIQIVKEKLATLQNEEDIKVMTAQVDLAELSVEEAELALLYLKIKAPVDGVVTAMTLRPGMAVDRGSLIAQIHQLGKMKIITKLSVVDIGLIEGKTSLSYNKLGEEGNKTAEIIYVSQVPDAESNTYTVELQVDNKNGELKPGMRVSLLLNNMEEQKALFIPSESIIREGDKSFVFIVNGAKVQKKEIELGRKAQAKQEVIKGIKEGDSVVIEGQHQLLDNDSITSESPEQ